jgi:ATP-binding cassette subfamily B protein
LVVALSIPLMLIASVRIRMLVLDYSRRARKINSDLTANYNEHINGIAINKSTAQERRVGREFEVLSDRMRHTSYRAAFYTALYVPVVVIIGSLAAAVVVFWGGSMATAVPAGITVGVLIASFDIATKIFMPITDISMFYATAQSSLSAGERIFSLIEEPIEIKDAPDATDFGRIRGEIMFRNIDFHYIAGHQVLKGFNLHIPAGQTLALVGATGEGKTTIANLVARFYQPTGGQLLIDGQNYMQKTLHSLRTQMGIVLQTPHLFSGTIRNNIRYGKPNATDAEITETLALVGASEFAARLDEQVGEEGGQLSVGEKQLLSFARALLINPAILIMDEATSSIDTITEARIQQSISRILKGRTAIVIAHRNKAVQICVGIFVTNKAKNASDAAHAEAF